jgi:hypothetical protein
MLVTPEEGRRVETVHRRGWRRNQRQEGRRASSSTDHNGNPSEWSTLVRRCAGKAQDAEVRNERVVSRGTVAARARANMRSTDAWEF